VISLQEAIEQRNDPADFHLILLIFWPDLTRPPHPSGAGLLACSAGEYNVSSLRN
jgi:hypothetical protein